jgi:hypothetical protein
VDKNPSDYQVTILGTPTWNGSVSASIRTYLEKYRENLQHVAIFSTGEGEEPRALEEMKQMLGNLVFAEMHLMRKKEIDSNNYKVKLDDFIERIESFIL